MRLIHLITFVGFTLLITPETVLSQLPPRLNIPGAILAQPPPRPLLRRPHHQQPIPDHGPPQRLRRPIPNAPPAPIRPVVEEPEEIAPQHLRPLQPSPFDDEVNKLGISALQSAIRDIPNIENGEEEDEPAQRQVQFRPERPLPVLRQERPSSGPPLRQQQPVRQSQPRQQVQAVRQPQRPRQQYNDDDEERGGRTRKPVSQILRKYRTDNADGSITWGYENDDGSFKEENLGIDCVTRGKYGYIDPDGVRREYSYETGNKCDGPQEEDEEELTRPQQVAGKGQVVQGQQQQFQKRPQPRPLPSQPQY